MADVASWAAVCVDGVFIGGILWVNEEGGGVVLALVGELLLGARAFGGSSPFFFLHL